MKKNAIKNYNDRNFLEYFLTGKEEQSFLNRIFVNYVRHDLTNYDSLIEQKGIDIGWVREEIYSKIAKAYPVLEEECIKQKINKAQEMMVLESEVFEQQRVEAERRDSVRKEIYG